MDDGLLRLMEELVDSIEQRNAGDPDAPTWEAQLRIQRLEEELARRVRTTSGHAVRAAGARPGGVGDEVLAGIG